MLYWWTVLSVFSDAAEHDFGSGAKSSFAVYWTSVPGQRPENQLPQLGGVRRLLLHDHIGVGRDRVRERRDFGGLTMCISLPAGTFWNATRGAGIRRRLGKRNFPAVLRTAANLMWFFSAKATSV